MQVPAINFDRGTNSCTEAKTGKLKGSLVITILRGSIMLNGVYCSVLFTQYL